MRLHLNISILPSIQGWSVCVCSDRAAEVGIWSAWRCFLQRPAQHNIMAAVMDRQGCTHGTCQRSVCHSCWQGSRLLRCCWWQGRTWSYRGHGTCSCRPLAEGL
jgi:hypothetical protein